MLPSTPAIEIPSSAGYWRQVPRSVGVFSYVGDGLARLDLLRPRFLADLRRSADLIVASDYSGEHRGAAHEVHSCLLIDPESLAAWDAARRAARARWLRDGRRIAFKNLRDRQHARALPAFLNAAEHLRGIVLTVAFGATLGPLFATTSAPRGPLCARWKDRTLEKVLRTTNLVSLLLAGLTRPAQNVLWITDNDAIAATHGHLRDLTTALAFVSSQYLPHGLGHLRCTTTGIQNDPSRLAEDLASIPDLVAGTYAAYLMAMRTSVPSPSTRIAPIVRWASAPVGTLARVFASIEPDSNGRPRIEVSTLGAH